MKKIATLLILLLTGILLTSCQSKWNVDVDLSAEERQNIKDEIKVLINTIENQINDDGTGEAMAYINLARDYEKLGDLKKSVEVYKDALDSGVYASSIYNNLGKLYEKIGEYDLAIEQYQTLVNDFMENKYLYDITWAYIRAKDRKNAEKYFNAWQLSNQTTDKATQDAIKKLREEEKAS